MAYVFLALATLAKGPVAPALAFVIILIFAALRREWQVVGATLWWPGILLFLLIAVPWYIAVQHATGSFFREFFLEQNLARFTTNLYRHKQPFWYYVPVLALSLAPWTVFAICGFIAAARRKLPGALPVFLVVWAIVPVIFFSLSQSKLPGYILPAIPAWALLLALSLGAGEDGHRPPWWLLLLHSAIAAAVLGSALIASRLLLHFHPSRSILGTAAAVSIVLFGAIVISIRMQGMRVLRFVTLVPVVIAVAYLLRVDAFAIDASHSARPVAYEIATVAPPSAPVAVLHVHREIEYGLNFYRNAEIPSYDRHEVPDADHVVVAAAGSRPTIAQAAPGRHISLIGTFAPQRLELYWVSRPKPDSH